MPANPLPNGIATPVDAALSPPLAALPPLLIGAKEAARLCGVGVATWWRLLAAGKVPAPVKLSGRTLWRAAELTDWTAAGCPDRKTWEEIQRTKRR